MSAGASYESWTPPADLRWAQAAQSDPPSGKPNPDQPYGCTYAVVEAPYAQEMGVGGAEPGNWVIPTCAGPGVIDPMPPMWVVNAQTQSPTPAANPVVLTQVREKS